MKAKFENIPALKGKHSFVAYSFELPFFEFRWHCHPEYELTLIVKGDGQRLVGDSRLPFSPYDLVLLGPDLPHTWSSDPHSATPSAAVVIQFTNDFIRPFSTLPEAAPVNQLLDKSTRGLHFGVIEQDKVCRDILALPGKTGISRITALLELLSELSRQPASPLSSPLFSLNTRDETEKRINKICRYIQDRAAVGVCLNEAAALVHLSPSAFCKFFRRSMNTSFSDYVNEVRVANACFLLLQSDKTVKEIAIETGYDSLTYFNRVFAKKKNCSPTAYRKDTKSIRSLSA